MNDVTIQLDSHGGKHLYQQIYDYMKQEIRAGELLCGERLPSTRALAEYLQVSRSTVELAYEQLLSEGYIESRPYKGFFVCEMEELYDLRDFSGGGSSPQENTDGYDYDFSPNGVELQSFPFNAWKRISRNVLSDERRNLFKLGDPQGDEELRVTIGRYLHASRGVNCRPEQIIVGAGNDYLLMLLEKILGGRRVAAIENPTYKRAYQIFCSSGYGIRTVGMDESGMQTVQLDESGADLAYVMPSHQYPSGIVMPIGRRIELLKWAARREERYLIEDDYDSEFRYRGKPIPSLQASDSAGKVIYMGTFSKAIAPAIRVSYMVLPQMLWEQYRKHCLFFSCTVSRIDQAILNEFIRDGYFERHLNKMRKIYKGRHDAMLNACRIFQGSFDVSGENAGLHLLLKGKDARTEEELVRAAAGEGVRVYGLSDTYIGGLPQSWRPTIMLGYAGLQEKEITEGIARLAKAWDAGKGGSEEA